MRWPLPIGNSLKQREVPGLLGRSIEERHAGVAVTLRSQVDPFARAAVALRPHERTGVEPAVDGAIVHHSVDRLAGDDVRPRERSRTGVLRIADLRHVTGSPEVSWTIPLTAQPPSSKPFKPFAVRSHGISQMWEKTKRKR